MSTRTFTIHTSGEFELTLDEQVISVVDDEWRSQLYNLHTPEDIAEHIAYNLIFNGGYLSDLDGWADQPDSNAKLKEIDVSITAEEIK
jgi:hypothetical protein